MRRIKKIIITQDDSWFDLPSKLSKTKREIEKCSLISRKSDFLPKGKRFLYLPAHPT